MNYSNTMNSLEGDPMRIYAERRPNEFQEQHFPAHLNEALRRCRPGSLSTPPDHTSITYTP
jgi:hypothetical protein